MSGLRAAVLALLEREPHPADHYVESSPSCPWCEGTVAVFGHGAESIRHVYGCPWVAVVEAVRDHPEA